MGMGKKYDITAIPTIPIQRVDLKISETAIATTIGVRVVNILGSFLIQGWLFLWRFLGEFVQIRHEGLGVIFEKLTFLANDEIRLFQD